MSGTPSRRPSSSQRRRPAGASGGSGRCSHSDASNIPVYPVQIRGPDGSPTARTYPTTPSRRQAKPSICGDNHGIKVPAPEQYLTPLQQKEVCIRHLRARLRENVERLHHRDFEIEELRNQLYKMQEDWIEEECHRVEAQLALKEARKEIQHLQEVVESVRSNLGVRGQDEQLSGAPGGRSRSCGCSPASTLSRGAPLARRSSEALQLERDLPEAAARPPGRTHLLLEAALLSEQLPQQARRLRGSPAGSRPASFERLCSGGAVLPVSHSCHSLSSSCRCTGHASLPHHHLFLHLPQEAPTAADPFPHAGPAPVPVAEKKAQVRSQACSPTRSWLSEESRAEPLSVISCAESSAPTAPPPPREGSGATPGGVPAGAHTRQPQANPPLPGPHTPEERPGEPEDGRSPELCHWSRYFLVDLLALAAPVVPTVAWFCRGAPQEVLPVYHIGSLLRGCCAVALHSLRQRGAEGRRQPAGTEGTSSG